MPVVRMLCLLMLCAGLARARVIMVDTNTAGDIVDVYVSDVGDKLEQTDASVAVAVIIHNHSRYRSVHFGNHYPIPNNLTALPCQTGAGGAGRELREVHGELQPAGEDPSRRLRRPVHGEGRYWSI